MTLNGYLNFTLSYFDPKDFENHSHEDSNMINPTNTIHPQYCRYRDFRHPPFDTPEDRIYAETDAFWHVLAARLAFVVVFQNCVALVVMAIKWIVPNIHSEVEHRYRREAYVTNEVIIRSELLKSKGVVEVDDEVCNVRDEAVDDSLITQESILKSLEGKKNSLESTPIHHIRFRQLPSSDSATGDVTDANIIA